MATLTGTNVRLRVREQIVRTEAQQIKLAYVCIVEVVPLGQPDVEGFVPVLAHQLVKLLLDVIHTFIIIKPNSDHKCGSHAVSTRN